MVQDSRIVNSGKNIALDRIYTTTPTYSRPIYFKVGINQADISDTTSGLTEEIPLTPTNLDNCETANWDQLGDSGTEVVNSNSGQFKEGLACLNLQKTGTSQTMFGYEKFGTSADFNGKDLFVWVYVNDVTALDSTKAVTVLLGTDSSNYYSVDKAQADLSNGWNFVKMVQDTATVTGTPVASSCSYYAIKFYTTAAGDTITVGDVRMDFWHIAESTDYYKAFQSGFPTIDETLNEVTIRCFLDTDEAVGHLIDAIAIYNSDGTIKIYAVDKFTADSKGATDQFTFIIVDRIAEV